MQDSNMDNNKIHRELFVGNTPPGTSEALLMQFLNAAMRRIQLCGMQENPIQTCRVNQKFAFVECTTSQNASQALNMNGIPFLGAVLKISRPSKYAGARERTKTWQELTGQTIPAGAVLDTSAEEKINRELFVGNTTAEMTESMIREFLGNALLQVGLHTMPGNPITTCRVSGKFAFIELRTPQEAANALNLNNIPFLGAQLRIGRPSKWNGHDAPHGNWEDILAKYMAGELSAPVAPATTRVVELCNMLTMQDLRNEQEYQEILEDTKEECSQFGQLTSIIIPKSHQAGATRVYLEYGSAGDAQKAVDSLSGRTFDGRQVQATFFDETKFAKREF